MEINDEKRCEVAQRLREVETLEYDGDEWCDEGDVLDALGLYNEDDPSSCNPDKVAFLADLIAIPTCRLDYTDAEPVTDGYPVRLYECSNCGCTCDEICGEYEYCPNCGAKVIE